MPRMAVTRLSDGRLQMWVAADVLWSSWQTSLDPAVPWTPLSQFDPVPPTSVNQVAAGHSPDGRVQLWTISDDPQFSGQLQTTWKISFEADSGWTAWQPFLPDPGSVWDIGVGQLSDGSMQLWAISSTPPSELLSTWKTSVEPGAPWNPWQRPFLPNPGYVYGGIAAGHSPNGRVQLWAYGPGPRNTLNVDLMSTWKKSGDPDSGWFDWQFPFLPDIDGQISYDVAVGQLSDDRMQLWAILYFLDQQYQIHQTLVSTWKTSGEPGASWNPWQRPFIPDPGSVVGVAAGQLADGRPKLWVVSLPGPRWGSGFEANILTSEKADSTPDAQWTDWQVFGNLPGWNP